MNKGRVNLSVCVLFLLILLCACAGPSFPHGTFVSPSGFHRVTFNNDGSFTFFDAQTAASQGTYSIQGNELTWETDSHCDAQAAGKAAYTWTYENDNLVLNVKGDDSCSDRLSVYNTLTYQLQR